MSVHVYTRTKSDGAWDTNTLQLSRDVEVAFPGKMFSVRAEGTVVTCDFPDDELTAEGVITLNALVVAHHGAGGPAPTQPTRNWQLLELPAEVAPVTVATFQERFSIVSKPLVGGVYLLTWCFEALVNSVTPGEVAEARFKLDGGAVGLIQIPSTTFSTFSGFDKLTAAEGDAPVLSLETRLAPGSTATSVEIRRMKLGIQAMSV